MPEQDVYGTQGEARMRFDYKGALCVLTFCIAYAVSVCYVLPPNLMKATLVVSSYNKVFSLPKTILCIAVVFLLKYILSCTVNREGTVSYYALRVLFFLYEIPVVLSYGLFAHDNFLTFWIAEIVYWVLICVVCGLFGKIRSIRIGSRTLDETGKGVRFVLLGIVLCGLVLSIRKVGGFSFSMEFLRGVYEARAYYKENTSDVITFFKTALGAFLCPCMIVFYCIRKRPVATCGAVLIQMCFFFLAKDKIYLFLIPLSLLVGILGYNLVLFFNGFLHAGYLLYGIALIATTFGFMQNMIYTVLTRRVMVVPSYFSYVYYDYFTKNPPIWWRQDTFLIDKFFTQPYPRYIPLQISHVYFNDLEGNPNAGMFAEAISRCGYFGVLIYPVIFCLMLRLMDKFYARAEKEVRVMMGICLALIVSNDVITSTMFVVVYAMVLLGSVYFNKRDAEEKYESLR